MQELNTPSIFDVDELETALDWFERKGGSAFCSLDHLNCFISQHWCELLSSGSYFLSSQYVPVRVGPDFGKVVIQIMQREAALEAVSA